MEVFDGLKWVHSGTQGQLFWCPARPPNWALCLSVPWLSELEVLVLLYRSQKPVRVCMCVCLCV